jgi:hypothetical protein
MKSYFFVKFRRSISHSRRSFPNSSLRLVAGRGNVPDAKGNRRHSHAMERSPTHVARRSRRLGRRGRWRIQIGLRPLFRAVSRGHDENGGHCGKVGDHVGSAAGAKEDEWPAQTRQVGQGTSTGRGAGGGGDEIMCTNVICYICHRAVHEFIITIFLRYMEYIQCAVVQRAARFVAW